MQISMDKCKKQLAIVWFAGAGFLFLVVFAKSIGGNLSKENSQEIWEWVTQSLVPVLSLIISVFVMDQRGKAMEKKTVDSFVYKIAIGFSSAYLLFLLLTLFLEPFSALSLSELIRQNNVFIIPLHGLVSAAIGVFFFKRD